MKGRRTRWIRRGMAMAVIAAMPAIPFSGGPLRAQTTDPAKAAQTAPRDGSAVAAKAPAAMGSPAKDETKNKKSMSPLWIVAGVAAAVVVGYLVIKALSKKSSGSSTTTTSTGTTTTSSTTTTTVPVVTTYLSENWNSGTVDTTKWNYVDDVVPEHGGHKTSVVNGELFINAYDDPIYFCGIITKTSLPANTKMTIRFKIVRIKPGMMGRSTLITWRTNGDLDANHYVLASPLFTLFAGDENSPFLKIITDQNTNFEFGTYVAGQYYTLEVEMLQNGTRVALNGTTVNLPKTYAPFFLHLGGENEDSIFDDLLVVSR